MFMQLASLIYYLGLDTSSWSIPTLSKIPLLLQWDFLALFDMSPGRVLLELYWFFLFFFAHFSRAFSYLNVIVYLGFQICLLYSPLFPVLNGPEERNTTLWILGVAPDDQVGINRHYLRQPLPSCCIFFVTFVNISFSRSCIFQELVILFAGLLAAALSVPGSNLKVLSTFSTSLRASDFVIRRWIVIIWPCADYYSSQSSWWWVRKVGDYSTHHSFVECQSPHYQSQDWFTDRLQWLNTLTPLVSAELTGISIIGIYSLPVLP